MLLRPATLEDAKLLFEWRNDPVMRMNARHTGEVLYETHLAWLQDSLGNPLRTLLVAVDEVPIGTIRFDRLEDGFELSWMIGPQYRGKGLGTKMIAEAIKNQRMNVMADIKNSNLPSISIAQKNGFVLLSKDGEFSRWIRRIE